MQNNTTSAIPYLDGWRGVAILLVLMAHFGSARLGGDVGGLGVLLFFVLSGFFMSNLLFIRKVSLPWFFVRRFSRVLPTLWIYIAAMYVHAMYFQPVPLKVTPQELLATFTFLRTYFPRDISIWSDKWANGQLWSLNVEEHAYLYLAAGVVLVTKAGKWITPQAFLTTSTIVVISFILYYLGGHNPSGASPWPVRTECAALGLLAAATYHVFLHSLGKKRMRPPALLVGSTFVAVFVCFIFSAHQFVTLIVAPLMAAFTVNHADDLPEFFKTILSFRMLRWFGVCSFSIYLWQQPFYLLFMHYGAPRMLCLPSAIALGFASFHFIENPFRIYLNGRYASAKRPTLAADRRQESEPASDSTCR